MAQSVIEGYLRWLEYESDAHAWVLNSMETVPEERRGSPEFRRAVSILAHVVLARRIWLARLGAAPAPPASAGTLFPEDAEVERVAADWHDVRSLWFAYLRGLDDAALDREVEYRSLDGKRFRNRVRDILDQLYGHSWYHRGQIAMLLRAAGGQPAMTDLIYWSREALPDSEA
ncbi:DinB family protein [Aquisphaera giovannonii]|uniref:DinB family protein n=1 Tax=Aquisphaera giovannonii TaxID=406548 RepID=A0A5B9VXA3_9BACT|nr:DinB family protein [Aquisphaera giovannonii]QEH32491.1 DinB family protein [Aquisphaera giovannonii]